VTTPGSPPPPDRPTGPPASAGASGPSHPSGWAPVRRSPFGQRVLIFSGALAISGFFGFSVLRYVQPSSSAEEAWVAGTALAAQPAQAAPPVPGAPPAAPPAAPAPPAPTGPVPDAGAGGDAPAADIVKITLQTIPPVKAEVWWGKKRLGIINGARRPPIKPLIIERPRDSGPIDILVKADTFLPVNTRAYTFNDNKVNVKLTLITEKHTLLGFKQALPDAGADGGEDGGVPPGYVPAPAAPVPYGPPPAPPPPQVLPLPP
jgi:hypothetical protein